MIKPKYTMNAATLFIYNVLTSSLYKERFIIFSLFKKHKIQFHYNHTYPDVYFEVIPSESKIFVGLTGLKKIWAMGRLFSEIYEHFSKQWQDNPNHATLLLIEGMENFPTQTLNWILNNDPNWETDPFLRRYFNRKGNPKKRSWNDCADELAMMVLTHIILHEIGHIVLKHSSESNCPRLQEIEADKWATNFLLDGIPPESNLYLKRSLGLMTSYLILLDREIRGSYTNQTVHPHALIRLLYTIGERLEHFQSHKAWMFMVVIFSVHLSIWQIATPQFSIDSPKEWFLALALYFLNAMILVETMYTKNLIE